VCRPKHVEQLRNTGIINPTTRLHLVGSFYGIYITIHGSMNIKDSKCSKVSYINPLNAELNPICHLLVLLGDLTFMGTCIVSIFQYMCISNKM
jgi:hypothetical protein